jgi:hypothetical protein
MKVSPQPGLREDRMMGCMLKLMRLTFRLIARLLGICFSLVGAAVTLLGVILIPAWGVGLLILPFGLAFVLMAWLIDKIL